MPWKGTLDYITGSVYEELLRRIEYLLEENRVLRNPRAQIRSNHTCAGRV